MKKLLLILMLTFISQFTFSQRNPWKSIDDSNITQFEKFDRASFPMQYKLYQMNLLEMKSILANAPLDVSGQTSSTILSFPDYNGNFNSYVIYEAPIMEKDLADRYQDIKSYVGKGINDPSATVRFSVTTFGLHLMMTSGVQGTYYIDTYTKNLNNYIVYSRSNVNNSRTFECLTQDEEVQSFGKNINVEFATDGRFRQYRLAMACTIEYAAFHVNAAGLNSGTLTQKKAAVLSAMNVTMTRVNGIYERDMSLRMNLVANNDQIIFIDSDSFDNNNAGTLINQSQSVINSTIGSANYDIGHTVSTGGGGLAGLGVVCNTSNKARGITGSPAPVGDPYDVDYVAHEIGHQFGGPHTFSGNTGSCNGNGSSANAVEPGSGSTIMAYAGICTPNNVQGNSDPYFHAVSIASMNAVMIGSGNCAPQALNGNTPPVISALTNYTIPRGTAFMLTGNASDIDGSASLTYCWEQTNAASGTNLPSNSQTTGPIYRSRNPSTSPTRYFPQLADLFQGNLTPTWEVTPDVSRTLNFALTVRDNQTPTGGQTARSNMTVTIDASRGPLEVTSQNVDGIVWPAGSTQLITWDVNGTNTSAGGNTVDILYTTDNGATWNMLLASTTNDGNQNITVPNISAPACRIMVKASGNIFFSVNTKNIAIGNYVYVTQDVCTDYVFNFGNLPIPENSSSFSGYSMNVTDSYTLTDANIRVELTHADVGSVFLGLRAGYQTSGVTQYFNGSCDGFANMNLFFDDAGTPVNCSNTTSGAATTPANPFAPFNGNNSAGSWIFFITDVATTDGLTGTIQRATLNLCRSEQVAVLSSNSFEANTFAVYPNPNNGTFTLEFTANSNVTIDVHDLRGRLILSKKLNATGLINEQISLQKAQKGIYLVTIKDGNQKMTKKIIVE